jgi:hypothetical protein
MAILADGQCLAIATHPSLSSFSVFTFLYPLLSVPFVSTYLSIWSWSMMLMMRMMLLLLNILTPASTSSFHILFPLIFCSCGLYTRIW